MSILKVAIFLLISIGVVKSKGLNKSIPVDVNGYSTDDGIFFKRVSFNTKTLIYKKLRAKSEMAFSHSCNKNAMKP